MVALWTSISDQAEFCLEFYELSEQRDLKSMVLLKLVNPGSLAPCHGTVLKALAMMPHSDAEGGRSANNLLKTSEVVFKDIY